LNKFQINLKDKFFASKLNSRLIANDDDGCDDNDDDNCDGIKDDDDDDDYNDDDN